MFKHIHDLAVVEVRAGEATGPGAVLYSAPTTVGAVPLVIDGGKGEPAHGKIIVREPRLWEALGEALSTGEVVTLSYEEHEAHVTLHGEPVDTSATRSFPFREVEPEEVGVVVEEASRAQNPVSDEALPPFP